MSGDKTGGVATSTDILIVATFVQLLLLILSHFLQTQFTCLLPGVLLQEQGSESETCPSECTLFGNGLMLLLPW
jgi:hypothetical protein